MGREANNSELESNKMNNKKSLLAGLIGLALLAGCSQAPQDSLKHSGLALANMDTQHQTRR